MYKRVAVCLLVSGSVFATDYTWNGTSDVFQTAANWSPEGVPGASDAAKFTTSGTYTVSFAGAVTNSSAEIGADVSFALNGYSWVLSGSSALSFSGSGVARIDGGTLEINPSTSRIAVGANRKWVLNGGTLDFRGASGSSLATDAGGTIEVNGGDHVLAWALQLNPPPSGGASFRMTGGRLSMTNNDNYARCSLGNGSRISLEGGTLSVRYQVDINGTPSAPAVIDIYTNATLLQNPGIGFSVSRTAGGLGIVNILGGSLVLSNSNLNVVNMNSTRLATTGIVNLVDGTLVAGSLQMGFTSNAVAIVRQTGGRMAITSTSYLGKDRDTLSILTQEGGSAWHNQLYVGGVAARGCVGELNLSGGTLAVVSSSSAVGKYADTTGRLLQTGGDLILSNSFSVGNAAGAVGIVTNTGGNLWLNGTLYLGNSGSALTGALGRACLAGTVFINSGIALGNSGADTGELVVAGGTLVSPNGTLKIGNTFGAVGRGEITDGSCVFKGLTVGDSGWGSLNITGGRLSMTNGQTLLVGNASNAVGNLTISGGTNYFNGANITIGQFGTGLMRVEGGYTYTTNRFIVGGGGNGVGRLELVGGVLSVPIIDGRDPTLASNPGGYSEVLFDGGTLQHSIDGESWMPGSIVSTFAKATLTDRGAVVDSNGGTIGIGQVLSNEVGYAGSFTKKGAGKLTLTAWYNAFTGRVSVEEGELAVSSSGGIYLTGGVAIDSGAVLNLSSAGVVRDTTTASGTVSRIDGALTLKSGIVLTNGVGATLGGSGVITGSVVFASGSIYGRDKSTDAGALRVTGNVSIPSDVKVALTGYTLQDLEAGIPLIIASGTLQTAGKLPVTLDGVSHPYWWATMSSENKTMTARVVSLGTMISVW